MSISREDIRELDRNTPGNPRKEGNPHDGMRISRGEARQLWNNDPGYKSPDFYHADAKDMGRHRVHWDKRKKDGFEKKPRRATLKPGKRLVRYGSQKGKFFASEGVDYDRLSLPEFREKRREIHYMVTRPIAVEKGRVARQFGAKKSATQYKASMTAEELLANGSIREIQQEKGGKTMAFFGKGKQKAAQPQKAAQTIKEQGQRFRDSLKVNVKQQAPVKGRTLKVNKIPDKGERIRER